MYLHRSDCTSTSTTVNYDNIPIFSYSHRKCTVMTMMMMTIMTT